MNTDLAALATRYDAFLIDQFGVLLDGTGAYPEAAASLQALAAMGKKIVLLSNSGKRAELNIARLTRLGFARDSYTTVLSSGEAAFAEIGGRIGKDIAPQARTWVHARDGDTSALDGLPLRQAQTPGDADLLIIAGSCAETVSLGEYRAWLAPAAKRGVPAFCTNPDLQMLTAQGQMFGAGWIARMYEDMGGSVEWVGKPFPLIYRSAIAALGDPAPHEVLCIGDSPPHDIVGGQGAGCATALVRTGLHADMTEAAVLEHCAAHAMPDYIIDRFTLGGLT